jgi:hypothetical protein
MERLASAHGAKLELFDLAAGPPSAAGPAR